MSYCDSIIIYIAEQFIKLIYGDNTTVPVQLSNIHNKQLVDLNN